MVPWATSPRKGGARPGPPDAVLVTHAPPSHVDPVRVRRAWAVDRLRCSGHTQPSTCSPAPWLDDLHPVADNKELTIGTVEITVIRTPHAVTNDGVPLPVNITYRIVGCPPGSGRRIRHDGGTDRGAAASARGTLEETGRGVDHLRVVEPAIAVLAHGAGLAPAHRRVHRGVITRFAPARTRIPALDDAGTGCRYRGIGGGVIDAHRACGSTLHRSLP